MPVGRNGLIGMAVAGTAGLGLIALIIYREVRRRRSQRVALEAGRTSRLLDAAEVAALLRENHDSLGQGGCHCAAAAAFTSTRARLTDVITSHLLTLSPAARAVVIAGVSIGWGEDHQP